MFDFGYGSASAAGVSPMASAWGMTADKYPLDHAFFADVITRIINEVCDSLQRRFQAPGAIEWE